MSEDSDLKAHFTDNVGLIREGPNSERSINDICCCVLFVLILLTMFIVGVYIMADQSEGLKQQITVKNSTSSNVYAGVFTNYYGLISVCLLLAVLLAIVYMILVRCFPKCMVYTLIILVFCIMFALLILGIVRNNSGLIISMVISILLFALFLFCIRNHIQTGIQLL